VKSLWPLLDRFPHLADVPRVALRAAPTPVEQIGERLWIKRDDLSAVPIGGNKVRALEFLLGQFSEGDRVVTGGSRGSTHVLATILHARRLGIDIDAASWPQEMNDVAREVDARIDREANRRHFRHAVTAAAWLTLQAWRGRNVIPAGGTSLLGMLGHVNAAFELAEQVQAGILTHPDRVIVPLGTGGTAVGLALGFGLSGLNARVLGVRVVPRIIARAGRLRRMSHGLQSRYRLTRPGEHMGDKAAVTIVESAYGGAYGRPLPDAATATPNGIRLDPTYSAKAFVVADKSAREANTLFWLTFDSRWMNA
jgi:1-aminocyclopropane-1-carboxylate deaminase/D-cysteine desulfhydrase-like pyridoxal-dependent ACC family enzyme